MEKLKRDEQQARKAIVKAFDGRFRAWAKARKWGYLKPTAFLKASEWFVDFSPGINTDIHRAVLSCKVKPFALDDLVSRILLFEGLDGKPLSLRARGPHCLVRPMFDVSVENEIDDVNAILKIAEKFSDEALGQIASLTLDDFIAFCGDGFAERVSIEQVAALILANRNDEALHLCEKAILTKQWGGPARMTDDGKLIGFFELARRWIGQR